MANELIIITRSGFTGVIAKLHINGLFAAQATMSEDATNVYRGDVPAILTGIPGEYNIAFYRNGGTPAERLIGDGVLFWDGTREYDNLAVSDDVNVSDGRLL